MKKKTLLGLLFSLFLTSQAFCSDLSNTTAQINFSPEEKKVYQLRIILASIKTAKVSFLEGKEKEALLRLEEAEENLENYINSFYRCKIQN